MIHLLIKELPNTSINNLFILYNIYICLLNKMKKLRCLLYGECLVN